MSPTGKKGGRPEKSAGQPMGHLCPLLAPPTHAVGSVSWAMAIFFCSHVAGCLFSLLPRAASVSQRPWSNHWRGKSNCTGSKSARGLFCLHLLHATESSAMAKMGLGSEAKKKKKSGHSFFVTIAIVVLVCAEDAARAAPLPPSGPPWGAVCLRVA